MSAKYDYLGNVIISEESHSVSGTLTPGIVRKAYTYDTQGRLAKEKLVLNSLQDSTKTHLYYDVLGRLIETSNQDDDDLSGICENLTYDIRGKLTEKEIYRIMPYEPTGGGGNGNGGDDEEEEEEPESIEEFIFGQYFKYFNPSKQPSQRRWNGLISEIAHQYGENGPVITNGYFYDKAGRLTDNTRYDGNTQTNKFTERDLTFDRNGNILSLKRYGATATAPQDSLAYTYSGNKLTQLNNSGNVTGSYIYTYDNNGNTVADSRRGLSFTWNHLNLPASISSNPSGTNSIVIDYTYLADGTKAITTTANEGYAYLGTMTYKRSNNTWTLESVPFTGGRFIANASGGFDEYRYITDHLGSTRVIVTGNDYHEVEHNDYYPFGMRIADSALPTVASNRWRFSGKEIQTLGNIGLVDFGARLYDSFRGQWPNEDTYSERYLRISPYSFCANDPINHYDPDGNQIGIGVVLWIGNGHILEHYGPNHHIKELGYAMNHPFKAFRVGIVGNDYPDFWISQKAANFASNVGNQIGSSTQEKKSVANAFRHVLWQAILTREFNSNQAERIGNAHEDAADSKDTEADQRNNAIGRDLGENNKHASNVELALIVLDEYLNNGLYEVVNDKVVRRVITQEQYEQARLEIMKKGENGLND